MYCPNCGEQTTQGLKFCKRCGASLSTTVEAVPRKFPTPLTVMFLFVIGGISLVGLAVPLAAADSLTKDFSTRDVIALVFGSWLVTLIFDAMLVWLLLRLIGISHQFAGTTPEKRPLPEQRVAVQIETPPEPLVSVTENTTRSFDRRRFDT